MEQRGSATLGGAPLPFLPRHPSPAVWGIGRRREEQGKGPAGGEDPADSEKLVGRGAG